MLRADSAFSPIAAGGILVVMSVVLALTMYAWASSMDQHADRPALGLVMTSGGIDGDTAGQWKTFTVHSASAGVHWWEVHVLLDGERIPCASTPGDADSWRLLRAGSAASCSGPRQSPDTLIRAGDQLEVWDHHAGRFGEPPLSGRALRILDAESNVIALDTVLR